MGYKVTLVSDTHSTWDSNELLAQQIINHHNSALNWFADVYLSNEIKSNDCAITIRLNKRMSLKIKGDLYEYRT